MSRRDTLGAAAALSGVFVLAGGLDGRIALVGLAAVIGWAALWRSGRAAPAPRIGGAAADTREVPPAAPPPDPPLWRAMLAALPDAAMMLDREAIVIAANVQSLQVLAAAVGKHVSLVARSPELLSAVEATLATGQPQSCQIRTLVPVERHLLGVVAPVVPMDSAPSGPAILVLLRDLTDQDRLTQMRADFVANASHELRTPLASLKGYIETMQSAAKDDAAAREQFLAIMQEQAARMTRLIEDLLSLSRIEMREHVAPTDRVDLAAVASSVGAGLRPAAEAAGITLAVAAKARDCGVIGDRDELFQVVQNLVQNAIKYGRRGGRVDVSIGRDGDRVVLRVVDDGIGIAPEHLPRLTERFYRVSAKDSRERGGTGLGLAIVKHIVNRHHGELRIESELAKGSTFTVTLRGHGASRHAEQKEISR